MGVSSSCILYLELHLLFAVTFTFDNSLLTTLSAGLEPESNDMWWREMSQEMQDAALFIGYTEEMWDADDADAGELLDFSNVTVDTIDEVANTFNIDSNYYNGLDWEELPPQVQDAATTLGYNQKRWDFGGEFSSRFV